MEYAYFCYHRVDDNMLETCISSLKAVSAKTKIVIGTDGVPAKLLNDFNKKYDTCWIRVPSVKMVKRRATCKIEILYNIVQNMQVGDKLLVSDVDIYFLSDPFQAFYEQDFNLGFTTRGYQHLFPINGGIFYIQISQVTKDWVSWHLEQVHQPTWDTYVRLRRRYKHERFGFDWSRGQDFLMACWEKRNELLEERDIKIVDVGPKYNFCPPTDVLKNKAFDMAWEALRNKSVVTLHLKSDLKRMIYDPRFPNAKLNYPRGKVAWL